MEHLQQEVPDVSRAARWLRKHKALTVAYEVQKNLRVAARARWARGHGLTAVRPKIESPADAVSYSRSVFDGFLSHCGLRRDALQNLRVLELGPGEDLCVALRFLAAGAGEVACVDRFTFLLDHAWERETYRRLLDDLDETERAALRDVVSSAGELLARDDRLLVMRGVGIERTGRTLGPERFDLIVSVAVLEHVYDLDAAIESMDLLLAPGGRMVHQVDLQDHGMFTAGGHHPLEFLTLAEPLYRLMTSHTGAPNRERAGSYRDKLAALGYSASIEIARVVGMSSDMAQYREMRPGEVPASAARGVDAIRGRLATRFRSIPTDDLAVTGILVRADKPVPAR